MTSLVPESLISEVGETLGRVDTAVDTVLYPTERPLSGAEVDGLHGASVELSRLAFQLKRRADDIAVGLRHRKDLGC